MRELKEIEKSLQALVGVQKIESMTRPQFVKYASEQIAKAIGEPLDVSQKRIEALQKAAAMVSSQFEDTDVESVKVSIYDNDLTANPEDLGAQTPASAAAKNPANGTVFEKKLEDLGKMLGAVMKDAADGDGPPSSRPPRTPAGSAGSEANTAPAGGANASQDDTDGDATKPTKAKKAVEKSVGDWPDDLNEKTQKAASDNWGRDDEPAPAE